MSQNNDHGGSSSLMSTESLAGGLMNLALGGLILWVGQTTFSHNGQISGITQQVEAVNQRHANLRDRHDRIVNTINDRTKARFTEQDGDKLSDRISQAEMNAISTKDNLLGKLNALRLQLSTLEMRVVMYREQSIDAGSQNSRQGGLQTVDADVIRQLRYDVNQLGSLIAGSWHAGHNTASSPGALHQRAPNHIRATGHTGSIAARPAQDTARLTTAASAGNRWPSPPDAWSR